MSESKQVSLRLSDIEVRENVRSEIDKKGIEELAQSISTVGLLQPITVSPNGGDVMVLVAGHRRVEAIRQGISDGILHPDFSIPAIVNDEAQDQGHRTVVQLIENLQRDDLPVMDEAEGYATLKADGLTQKEIAQRVSKSEGHISKRLKLLTLPEDVQVLVNQGQVPLEVAIELPSVPEAVARDIAKLGMKATVRDVKARKANADSIIAKEKINAQLDEAGITVWKYRHQIEIPEGKEARLGEPVTKVADLPKRLAGVILSDYASDVELTPVTFRKPSASELEHQEERLRTERAAEKARENERKRLLKAVDTFVDNPPPAGDLVSLLARVIHPTTYGVTSTFLASKDAELKEEGRSIAEWRLSGEMSSLEARKFLATMLLQRIEDQSRSMGYTSEEVVMGLIDLGATVGVKFGQHTEDYLLRSLAAVWARDEQLAAQAEADVNSDEEATDAKDTEEESTTDSE